MRFAELLKGEAAQESALVGQYCFGLAKELWPINRSLTGPGVRQTLDILRRELPGLALHSVPSGSQILDWTVPDEWSVREAWIEDADGRRLVDFADNNLHLVGYSEPFEGWVERDVLERHLHSLPEQPLAIPYVTSYYRRDWGFCVSHEHRQMLGKGPFKVNIDSSLEPGQLDYGELVIPGESRKEVLLSTYVCHPSMANNELSGPVVATALGRWLAAQDRLKYTYRLIFVPETIGAIAYLSRKIDHLREHVIAGFLLTCLGDERSYSYVPSRASDTIADRVAQHVLKRIAPDYRKYTWLDRGSDERQFCAPRVDLPMASIMRSKYGEYPEYHTSLDTLGEVVTARGLQGGFDALHNAIHILENDIVTRTTVLGEPQLGKRGLYPTISTKHSVTEEVQTMMDVISYCDGRLSHFDIAEKLGLAFDRVQSICAPLMKAGLLEVVD